MTPSPFPPSKWEMIGSLRREDPSLSETGAAYRIIDDLQEKIQSLNAQLNQARFISQLRGYLLMGVLLIGTCALAIKTVLWWVKRLEVITR